MPKPKQKNVTVVHTWIEVPVRSDVPGAVETYLVPTRLAEYIVRLENKIKGELPRLPKKR